MSKYDAMTTEDFDRALVKTIEQHVAANGAESLLQIPGVYEVLSEHFNNDALDLWESEQEQEADA